MNEAIIRAELNKIKAAIAGPIGSFDQTIQNLDPKADGMLGHIIKSKRTLCWIAALVFLNTVFSIWIGLKL